MPSLSASELPPEALHAGDTIEYFSRAFVCGDHRGYRRAVVTRVDGGDDVGLPVAVDSQEVIPMDLMLKRVVNHHGTPVKPGESKWRKLRTYMLVPGRYSAPTRASALISGLQAAVAAAYQAVRSEVKRVPEGIVLETPQSSECSSPAAQTSPGDVQPPSTPPIV